MEKVVRDFLIAHNVPIDNQIVVVGVSTGVDSMVLLFALEQILTYNQIIVAHINHQKRKSSDDEEMFIQKYCEDRHIRCFVMRLPKIKSIPNFQSYAREKRYTFFKQIMDQEQANVLLLAHHLNDDIETMLMRLVRSSQLVGYAGIMPVVRDGKYTILRPLLTVLKEDIIAYAKKHEITYFEDVSNNQNQYTRNRIRKYVVPRLLQENTQAHAHFLSFKNAIIEASKYVANKRDEIIASLCVRENDKISFPQHSFLSLESFMQEEVLFELLQEFAFSKANIQEIIKLIQTKKANMKVLYKGLTCIKEYDLIHFVLDKQDTINVRIVIDAIKNYPIGDNRVIKVKKNTDNSLANLNRIWYNSSMLPVVVRTRCDGDRITVTSGTKKIKKILIDKKVGISQRENVLVCEKDGQILAVFGYAKSSTLLQIENPDILIELSEEKIL